MKLFFIKIIKYLFIPFGIIYKAVKKEKNKINILMYHRVNDGIRKEISVTASSFRWQMSYLNKKGFKVISMDEALEMLTRGDMKGKYIVLTFDDGYSDFYTNAYPVLEQFAFPSLVYLVPGFIETGKVFWWDRDVGESSLMNWTQICDLKNRGHVQFGSHTFSHPDLNLLDDQSIEEELVLSKQVLQDKLHKEVRHFAYPRGIYAKSAEWVEKGIYDTGVLIFDGMEITGSGKPVNPFQLKRMPVQRSDGKYLFVARLKGWLVLEEIGKKLFSKY